MVGANSSRRTGRVCCSGDLWPSGPRLTTSHQRSGALRRLVGATGSLTRREWRCGPRINCTRHLFPPSTRRALSELMDRQEPEAPVNDCPLALDVAAASHRGQQGCGDHGQDGAPGPHDRRLTRTTSVREHVGCAGKATTARPSAFRRPHVAAHRRLRRGGGCRDSRHDPGDHGARRLPSRPEARQRSRPPSRSGHGRGPAVAAVAQADDRSHPEFAPLPWCGASNGTTSSGTDASNGP